MPEFYFPCDVGYNEPVESRRWSQLVLAYADSLDKLRNNLLQCPHFAQFVVVRRILFFLKIFWNNLHDINGWLAEVNSQVQ